MLAKVRVVKILMGVLMLILLAVPQLSYADWSLGIGVGGRDHHDDRGRFDDRRDHRDDHHFYGWRDRPHWGYHMHFLPDGYFTVWAGGQRYYYYDGLYYTYVGAGDYVIVNPPIGAFVSAIPPDFQSVSINGRIYYSNGGVYYVLTHHGYKVVPPPVVYVQPQPVVIEPPPVAAPPAPVTVVAPPVVETQDAFPINVPNDKGGYTSVVIKKKDKGYVGPQGEFYDHFPTVAQLKAMYSK